MQYHHTFGPIPAAAPRSICVTGGAGFLGSHLCERLVAEGHSVTAIDNLHTGRPGNVGWLESTGRFRLAVHDIVQPLPAGLPRFDEIYNLACPASPVHYQTDPLNTLAVCAQGTQTMAERALRDGARLLHSSTSEVYGDPDVHPQRESYCGNVNPVGPRACYDEGKRFAETLLTEYAAVHGLTVRIARIFNTYGPRMQPDDGRVVSNFVLQALRGEDITVYGEGTQTRSFCFVTDLIDGLIRLLRSDAALHGPVNLGNPEEVEVRELAQRVIAFTGSPSRIVVRPLPQDDPRRRKPDIARARALLGWQPTVPLETGLRATIAHFAGLDAPAAPPVLPLRAIPA